MNKFDELIENAKNASKKNDYIKSNDFYNQALNYQKEEYLFFEIAKNYLNMNSYSDAEKYFTLYLDSNHISDDFSYYSLLFLAKIYKLTGFFKKAIDMCEKAKKYAKDDLRYSEICEEIEDINFLFYERIPKNLKKEEYKDLEIQYSDRLLINPNNINSIVNLAEIYLIKREYKKLVEFIKEKIDLIHDDDLFFKNKLVNFIEISQGKTVLNSKPIRLGVNLSNNCNLQCIMCYVKDYDWNFPKERLNEIKEYFPYLEKIMWQGGEVFCLDYFVDLIKEASQYPNLQQGIITNGQLLNEQIIDLLVNMNLELTISIDGVCKKTYESIRKNASFEKLVKNIQYLSSVRNKNNKNFILGMNVVVSKHNDNELLSLFEIAHRYNFDFFCIMPLKQGDIFEIYNNNLVTKQITEIQNKSKSYNILVENRITLLSEQLIENVEYNIDINDWLQYENKSLIANNHKSNEYKYYIYSNAEENDTTFKAKDININEYNNHSLVCHIPWMQLILDYDATIWPDCQCRIEKNKNKLCFSDMSFPQNWNSKEFIYYRKMIIDNEYKNLCKDNCIDGKICDNYIKTESLFGFFRKQCEYKKALEIALKQNKDFINDYMDEILFCTNQLQDNEEKNIYYEQIYKLCVRNKNFLDEYIHNLVKLKQHDKITSLIEKLEIERKEIQLEDKCSH